MKLIVTKSPIETRKREALQSEIAKRGSLWQLRMAYFTFFGYDQRIPDFMNMCPERKFRRYISEHLTMYFTEKQLKSKLKWL
ncbi:MAG: hypothetical protein IKR17_04735 [Bacteroidales bacterium]|nr:hypothetical protein [Bacteroidales bacterium]